MKLTTAATAALITLGPLPKVTAPPTAPTESAPAPTAAKTAGEATPTVKKPQVKKPAPKLGGPGNPVHDTIKTVRGMLDNTRKTWTPKPKKATAPKADTAAK